MKRLMFAVLLAVTPAAPAAAGDIPPEKRAEAQAEVDKAKADACVKTQAFLAKYKDKCPDQAGEAAKITCDAAAFKKMNELNSACMQVVSGKGTKVAADAKATKEAAPAKDASATAAAPAADKNACSATDESGAVIATATAEKAMDCRNQIKEAVMKAKCTDGVKKYKFSYTRGTMKPSSSTVYCKK